MKVNNDKKFDMMLKDALEEYLMEDIDRQLEELEILEKPEFSEEHKKFIKKFFEKEKNKKKNNWKKWLSVVAVFLGCCIFFNQNITAGIKQAFNNVSTKQTEISFDVKKKVMNVKYDLNAFPKGWDILFLPNDLINGYVVEKIESDKVSFEITFVNRAGSKLIYTVFKNKGFSVPQSGYEMVEFDNKKGYYYESESVKNLVLQERKRNKMYEIQLSAKNIEKKELIWIAKNIICINK